MLSKRKKEGSKTSVTLTALQMDVGWYLMRQILHSAKWNPQCGEYFAGCILNIERPEYIAMKQLVRKIEKTDPTRYEKLKDTLLEIDIEKMLEFSDAFVEFPENEPF